MLATQHTIDIENGSIREGTIVKIKTFVPNMNPGHVMIVVLSMDILHTEAPLTMVLPEEAAAMFTEPALNVQSMPPAAPASAPAPAQAQAQAYGSYGGYGGYDASAAPAAAPPAQVYGGYDSAPAAPAPAPASASASSWNGGYGAGGMSSSFNTKPIQRDNSSQQVTPIRALNPYSNRWTLKARVTHKSEMKSWKNPKGEGTLFSIDLIDQDKTEIRGTFFKEACQKFYGQIAQGSVYFFSGGKLKPVQNRQFTNIVNDYEITFDNNSSITPAAEDGAIAVDAFNFVKISQIKDMEANTNCDVLGLVKEAGAVSTITSTKQGNKEIFKRDLTIVDDSNTEIRLTLWGKQAQDENAGWDSKPIVAFKGCKIGDYGGRTLSMMNNGSFTIAPQIEEGRQLFLWVQAQGGDVRNIHASSISGGGGGGGGGGRDLFENRKPCASIKTEDLGRGEKPDWPILKLNLIYAKADNDPWYTACTNGDCKKKVVENMQGGYRCEKCGIDSETCTRRYILSTQMGDYSGSEWFSFFDEQATALLGKTADEMYLIKTAGGGDEAFQAEIRKALFKQYIVKAKVKYEDVAATNEPRRKCSVVTLEPVNYKSESTKMLEAIAKYQ